MVSRTEATRIAQRHLGMGAVTETAGPHAIHAARTSSLELTNTEVQRQVPKMLAYNIVIAAELTHPFAGRSN